MTTVWRQVPGDPDRIEAIEVGSPFWSRVAQARGVMVYPDSGWVGGSEKAFAQFLVSRGIARNLIEGRFIGFMARLTCS
jgi:hypothetical protein